MTKLVFIALATTIACAAPIEVVKVASIDEAARANGSKLKAVAIIRGQDRAAVPPDVTIDANKTAPELRVPRPGIFTYALDPDEVVVRDDQTRIIGVKTGVRVTKFIAGTASLEGKEVHGELEGHEEHVPLLPTDHVELRGTFAPNELVPTGGKVAITRAWSALIFGSVLLGGGWLPSVIVGATSGVDANHWLYVPVIGPWIAYVTRDQCNAAADPAACLNDAGSRVALIFDGIIQSTGAVLMLVGVPSSAEVRWGKDARIHVAPRVGLMNGLAIEGVF